MGHATSSRRRVTTESPAPVPDEFYGLLRRLSGRSVAPGGGRLAALEELCESLSVCDQDTLDRFPADAFVPYLVKLAGGDRSGDPKVPLYAACALTYLAGDSRAAAGALVRHGALPVLCSRLLKIDYLNLAEQCLQALERMSQKKPRACLRAGAIVAVLTHFNFFSVNIQGVAMTTVENLCEDIPSDCCRQVMKSVPLLCKILYHEDQEIVGSALTCLRWIAEGFSHFSDSFELLDELCEAGVIAHCMQFRAPDRWRTLSPEAYCDFFGLLTELAAGSLVAVRTLFERNISSILKRFPACSGSLSVDVYSLVNAVLELLIQLIPPVTRTGQHIQLALRKEEIAMEQPKFFHQSAIDILPFLIEVVKAGANSYVRYGCACIVNSIVYFSTSDLLLDLNKNTNISSFLASLLASKNNHVLFLTLKIIEILMEKLPDVFSRSFAKEGVVAAIHALLLQGVYSKSLTQDTGDDVECFCSAYCRYASSSESNTCRMGRDLIHPLVQTIQTTYFAEPVPSKRGLARVLQKLDFMPTQSGSAAMSSSNDGSAENEDYLNHVLTQVVGELEDRETMSTFEFIESGVVRFLVHYLSNGKYLYGSFDDRKLADHLLAVQTRIWTFARIFLVQKDQSWDKDFLSFLVRMLQDALSSFDHFPVVLSDAYLPINKHVDTPVRRSTFRHLKICFMREEGETYLCDYGDVLDIELCSSLDAMEEVLWPKVSKNANKHRPLTKGSKHQQRAMLPVGDASAKVRRFMTDVTPSLSSTGKKQAERSTNSSSQGNADNQSKLIFCFNGKQLDRSLTLYQSILQDKINSKPGMTVDSTFWEEVHIVTYRRAKQPNNSDSQIPNEASQSSHSLDKFRFSWQKHSLFSSMMYDLLFMLKTLEGLNRYSFQVLSYEKIMAFAEGRVENFDALRITSSLVPQAEFISSKLSNKLEQQMRDTLAFHYGSMPPWCTHLMAKCPFLFSFKARWKYFCLTLFGSSKNQHAENNGINSDDQISRTLRSKYRVNRSEILESAAEVFALHSRRMDPIELEFNNEIGSGQGPTREFYTMVSHRLQKIGLGVWRGDQTTFPSQGNSGFIISPCGLFPRPWPAVASPSNGVEFSEVIQNFFLLGQLVARAILDGRILDLPLAKAFYKVILEQELDICDIQSFAPRLGRTLIEFQALVNRKRFLESGSGSHLEDASSLCFRGGKIEDLCLDFTLPGYSEYMLTFGGNTRMVNIDNLEEYVSLVVDATVKSGISRQLGAFKSGINEVFPLKALQIFTEEELERIICGEQDTWASTKLVDHIKFDHGYTARSSPIINLLEIIRESGNIWRRAFLQFVTGSPRLPLGGLAALNPKLTIVRKHCEGDIDMVLPSAMTCAHYLKLPAYSSKGKMKERLLYAITEGQESFHFS